ncbi:MAG: hypothetical protein PF637_08900 [Spirochaetes bacterium]|jgi:hypothetical protein|nr:hypothetical protein [Spirochaetota bacterium]
MIQRLFYLFIILFLYSTLNYSHTLEDDPRVKTAIYTFDKFEYTVVSDKAGAEAMSDASMYKFHLFVKKQYNNLLSRFRLSPPHQIKITVCNENWIFTSLTGEERQAAGLFVPGKRMLYLQRVEALHSRGILSRTVTNELLLLLLNANRSVPNTVSLHILEEAFCEYLFNSPRKTEVGTLPEKYSTFSRHIHRAIRGDNVEKREKAYALLNRWGTHLIEKIGTEDYLRILLTEREEKRRLPEIHYRSFQENFTSGIPD